MSRFKEVIDWLQEFDPVVDPDGVKRDLAMCHEFDGYEFCRNLENKKHWSVDAALVEILDGAKKSEFE